MLTKALTHTFFDGPKSSFGEHKNGTKGRERLFEVLCNGVSTRFGLPLIENSFKNAYATLCSTLENSSFGDHKIRSRMFDQRSKISVWGAYIWM